jgi:hypothetical protein
MAFIPFLQNRVREEYRVCTGEASRNSVSSDLTARSVEAGRSRRIDGRPKLNPLVAMQVPQAAAAVVVVQMGARYLLRLHSDIVN